MAEPERKIKPLGGKAYGSIPHLPGSRLGPGDHHVHEGQDRICCSKTRDKHDHIVVQEKLDGTCVAAARIDGAIVPLIRAGYHALNSPRDQHRFFAEWCFENQDRLLAALVDGERLCGEWCVQAAGTRYAFPHEPFIAFDIMIGKVRATAAEVAKRCAPSGIATPRVIHQGSPISIEAVVGQLEPSGHGAIDPVEGAVWRVERKGTVDFLAKYVRPTKADGYYFPDREGAVFSEPVWNKWTGWRAL